jgi:hypothetical protein
MVNVETHGILPDLRPFSSTAKVIGCPEYYHAD